MSDVILAVCQLVENVRATWPRPLKAPTFPSFKKVALATVLMGIACQDDKVSGHALTFHCRFLWGGSAPTFCEWGVAFRCKMITASFSKHQSLGVGCGSSSVLFLLSLMSNEPRQSFVALAGGMLAAPNAETNEG